MKIYVASKFEAKDTARLAMSKLRLAGHEITHDWTQEDDSKAAPGGLDVYHARCAEQDLAGVLDADALVVFPHDRGKGLFVELGAALAHTIPVVCVGDRETNAAMSVFLKVKDVTHVPTVEAAVAYLDTIKGGWARRVS